MKKATITAPVTCDLQEAARRLEALRVTHAAALRATLPAELGTVILHQTDDLAAPGENCRPEGAETTEFQESVTEELNNKTQILAKAVSVSGTVQAVRQGGAAHQYNYQLALRTKELKIRCDKATPVNLDGELRMAQVVDFKLADEKLRFFYPKGLVWRMKEQVLTK